MKWETPAFVEINMSAEIGGYQSDFDAIANRLGPAVPRVEHAAQPDASARSALPTACASASSARPRAAAFRSGTAAARTARRARGGAGARVRPRTPGVARRQRRRRVLVPDQRSPEIRAQIEALRGAAAARRATRPSPASCSPTATSTTAWACSRCASRTRWSSTRPTLVRAGFTEGNVLYRTLERFPGQVDLAARSCWATSWPLGERTATGRASITRACRDRPGKLPLHLEGLRDAVARGQRRPRDSRRAHGRAASRISPASRAVIARATARRACAPTPTSCSSTAPSGRSDELIAAGLGTRRAEDMAHWPIGGRGRQPRLPRRACRRGDDLHPRQQHQPDPARGRPRAARRRAPPASRSPTTAWSSTL